MPRSKKDNIKATKEFNRRFSLIKEMLDVKTHDEVFSAAVSLNEWLMERIEKGYEIVVEDTHNHTLSKILS